MRGAATLTTVVEERSIANCRTEKINEFFICQIIGIDDMAANRGITSRVTPKASKRFGGSSACLQLIRCSGAVVGLRAMDSTMKASSGERTVSGVLSEGCAGQFWELSLSHTLGWVWILFADD
jgi:hypothetical protein